MRQTLREQYGREFDELEEASGVATDEMDYNRTPTHQSSSNGPTAVGKSTFFMCTTCGYRGNTSRGVKQHGKMHLSAREHFAIINATPLKPYLVYTSLGDVNLASIQQQSQSQPQQQQPTTESEMIPEPAVVEQKSKPDREPPPPPSVSSMAPFSKKARLLEYNKGSAAAAESVVTKPDYEALNHDEEDEEEDEDEAEETDSDSEQVKIQRPQTYCHKCSTQFQHVRNFHAHKKFYCKDD